MISVLTLTNRDSKGVAIIEKALKRQTFKDFEWVIGCPDEAILAELTIPYIWIKDPQKDPDDVWCLNKAYNNAIKNCKGDLIVSIQDYTFFDPDALEKFYFHFREEPKSIITGVGNKYQSVYPELSGEVWADPRINNNYGTYYPCYFNDVEGNFCSVPKEAFYAVGGFDEILDKHFGMDFYSVLHRLDLIQSWEFKINQTIRSYSLEHSRPDKWDELNMLGNYHEYSKNYYRRPKLSYL